MIATMFYPKLSVTDSFGEASGFISFFGLIS